MTGQQQVVTMRVLVRGSSVEQPEKGVAVMHRLLDLVRDMPDATASEAALDDLNELDREVFAAFLP